MGRFDWLELPAEGQAPTLPQEAEAPELLDDRHYLQLAVKAFEEGDFEQALRYYSRALRIDRQLSEAWSGQVKCLIEMGEVTEAKTWAEKGLAQLPKDPELLSSKALLLAKSGMLDDAMGFSDQAMSRPSSSAYPWLVRAEILLTAGSPGMAQHCFDKALELSAGDWRIRSQAGHILLRNGRLTDAVAWLQQAAEAHPTSPQIWTWLGRASAGLGLNGKARFCFEKALQIQPRYQPAADALREVDPAGWLGGLWSRIGRWFEAR